MDSTHTAIDAWWPRDGAAFATRAYERLVRRAEESEQLLGSNLKVPDLANELVDDSVVTVDDQIKEVASNDPKPWDGIQDALEPVRHLVSGSDPLVPPALFEYYRHHDDRVLANVSVLRSGKPWAFFSVTAIAHGAPRWLIVEPEGRQRCVTDLHEVVARLRILLADNPSDRDFDQIASVTLDQCLDLAVKAERLLLPRRMQRALEQMHNVLAAWAAHARHNHDEITGQRRDASAALAATTATTATTVDPYQVAKCWLGLIAPVMAEHRATVRSRYILLRHLTPVLRAKPMPLEDVSEAFYGLPEAIPLEERVAACIIGVP